MGDALFGFLFVRLEGRNRPPIGKLAFVTEEIHQLILGPGKLEIRQACIRWLQNHAAAGDELKLTSPKRTPT